MSSVFVFNVETNLHSMWVEFIMSAGLKSNVPSVYMGPTLREDRLASSEQSREALGSSQPHLEVWFSRGSAGSPGHLGFLPRQTQLALS